MVALDIGSPAARFEVGEWPDLTNAQSRAAMTPTAVRAMTTLADIWGLTIRQIGDLLGGIPASTWHSWKANPPAELSVDQLTRVSLLLGMFTALHVLHAGPIANTWIALPNSNRIFAGRSPLQAMIDGGIPAMAEVRALLDGRRGGL